MDNREVLVKLQYNTKYGVQLNSSRIIRNYNLYKYLVLKNVSEQVYIDYANEDCEMINVKCLFDDAYVTSDKEQITSYNNLKELFTKDINVQCDLFSLIDNAYIDILGHTVEKDLSFDKYSYFYRQFLDISRGLMNKYIGTDNYPKDINELYRKELGDERYNLLLQWLNEPIINDVNINCVINCVQNLTNKNNSICKLKESQIPLHIAAKERTDFDTQNIFAIKEKVIITKNMSGFYTFKDLIFNIQNSNVIGKWNNKTNRIELLSKEDVKLCELYNFKYDKTKINDNVTNLTNVDSNILSDKIINNDPHQSYEIQKQNNNKSPMISHLNNLKELISEYITNLFLLISY